MADIERSVSYKTRNTRGKRALLSANNITNVVTMYIIYF